MAHRSTTVGRVCAGKEVGFLEEVFAETNSIRPLLAQHPEYQELAARMMHLYKEITDKGLQNEKESR